MDKFTKHWKKQSLEAKKTEYAKIRKKYSDHIPVVVFTDGMEIDKHKYLLTEDLTAGHFLFIIRKRLKLKEDEAIFMSVGKGIMVPATQLLKVLYSTYKDESGFLYINITKESTFG